MARLPAGVRKRSDGKLEKRFTVNGKRYSIYGVTVKEITEKEQGIREKIRMGFYTENRDITLDQYFREWITRKETSVRETTIYRYNELYKVAISPELGSKKIVDIERREIYQLQQNLMESYSAASVNIIIQILKMIFKEAMIDDIILKSPANGIKSVKGSGKRAVDTKHRALTEEEQKIFMEEAKKNFYYEYMAFLLLTGMRCGEASALTWSDIDYVNNVIHITKTITCNTGGHLVVGETKTKSGNRDIPMNESIRSILQDQKKKQVILNGSKIIPIHNRVFTTSCGGAIMNATANRMLKVILKKLEAKGEHIDEFTLHAFRDTFATRYIEQGGNPQTLKTLLGHSSLKMTMDLYSHVLPNTKQKEMDMIRISV